MIGKHQIDYPVTSHQSPVPSHQSPVTSHKSTLYRHHSPNNKQQTQGAHD
ncbi:hypothetical protein [Sphaerospermopsis reniformis]|nr:hypothetical protein [Sphaerospermopsis reniformis]